VQMGGGGVQIGIKGGGTERSRAGGEQRERGGVGKLRTESVCDSLWGGAVGKNWFEFCNLYYFSQYDIRTGVALKCCSPCAKRKTCLLGGGSICSGGERNVLRETEGGLK